MLRFTNSGTESTMYAVRVARAYTGRKAIIKIEGGYHGGYDGLSVSVARHRRDRSRGRPDPAGALRRRARCRAYSGLQTISARWSAAGRPRQGRRLRGDGTGHREPRHRAARRRLCRRVRKLCDDHNVLLIFDEVKTGLTAGAHGAAACLGVKPDLITRAKSIGGGLPLAAFGGTEEVAQVVVDNRMAHFGTYNGNLLCMAGHRGRRGRH